MALDAADAAHASPEQERTPAKSADTGAAVQRLTS